MGRSKTRTTSSSCPRCATVMERGGQVCPICRLDLAAPEKSLTPEPVPALTTDAPAEAAVDSPAEVSALSPVEAAMEAPIESPAPPAGPVLLPLTAAATAAADPYDSIPVGYTPIGSDEPTPLAPEELLAPVWSITADDTAPVLINPKDPFSWAPVVHA